MTSVFASRRRAEEFSSLVEAPAPGAPRDARTGDLLAVVGSLRSVPAPDPRPEFVDALRAELMAAADTLLLPAPEQERLVLPTRSRSRDRRLAAAIGGLALVGAGTSMAVAAQTALPGEMLYPLKRAIEDAETRVASGRDTVGLTLLDNASTRLSEVEALGREGALADESAAVSTSFVDFGTQASAASDLLLREYAETGDRDLVRELRDFTGDSMDTLGGLESQVPASARDELVAAVAVVGEIDARARQACPSCGGRGVEQIPPVLLTSAATDASAVVIPGATVKEWSRRGEDHATATTPRAPRAGRDEPVGDDDSPGTLATDPLVTSPGDGTGGSGGGSTGSDGPLGGLAGAVTGDDPTTSTGGATGGDGVTGTVKESVEDAGKTVEETAEELGDTLTGD